MDLFPANESRFISKADVGFRLDRWKSEAGKNILLVTGHSGSGKTTLAKQIARRPHHHCIELDWFDWFRSVPHPDNPDWSLFTSCFSDLSLKNTQELDRVRRIGMFETGWLDFKKKCAQNPTEMYVVEGIQIITMMPYGASNGMARDVKEMPLLIKGTSAYTSVKRARKRSTYPEGFLEMLIDWLGYDKRNRKFMAEQVASAEAQDPADFGIYD